MLKFCIPKRRNRSGRGFGVDSNQRKELSQYPHANVMQTEAAPATGVSPYAKCEDFRRLFVEKVDSLYQLCFLLTTDPDKAEQYLLAGLDDCVKSHQVFREWAHTWAKRTLIQNAVRGVRPCSTRGASSWPTQGFRGENPQSDK